MEGESICRCAKENWSASDEGRWCSWIWSCWDKSKINPFQSHDSTISQCSWTRSSKPTWRVTHLGFITWYCFLIVTQFRFNLMQFHLSFFTFCIFLVISISPFLYSWIYMYVFPNELLQSHTLCTNIYELCESVRIHSEVPNSFYLKVFYFAQKLLVYDAGSIEFSVIWLNNSGS